MSPSSAAVERIGAAESKRLSLALQQRVFSIPAGFKSPTRQSQRYGDGA
jgi:hypothetical protein